MAISKNKAHIPRLDWTVSRILDAIHDGSCDSSGTLPSVKDLAKQLNVSMVTAWRACRELAGRGILRSIPGQGFAISEFQPPESRPTPGMLGFRKRSTAARIYSIVERELITGMLGHGQAELSPKEVASRYGVDSRTARKAINALISDGVLQPHGRAAAVRQPLHGSALNHVTLVLRGSVNHSINLPWWVDPALIRECETAAYHAGAGLRLVTFATTGDIVTYHDPITGRPCALDTEHCLGFLYLIIEEADLNQNVIQDFSARLKPVAIMDGKGTADTSVSVGISQHIKRFNFSTVMRLGSIMGRYLTDTGHRRVAYLSAFHDQLWSHRRLDGLRLAMRAAGSNAAVDSFCFDINATEAIARRTTPDGMDLVVGPAWFNSPRKKRTAEILPRRIDCNMDTYNAMQEPARSALLDKSITAWVGCNDTTALALLAYLGEHGIAVPQGISVAGFDNSVHAPIWGLTSYDHNLKAVINAGLNYILRPLALGSWGRKRVVAIDGYVVQRASSARIDGGRTREGR